LFAFVTALLLVVACGSDFAPKNAVSGVRILAARADLPYARPGEAVHIQGLAHDGRKAPAEPMRVFWFPAPCVDPPTGQYYGCYLLFDALFPVGTDLTSSLVEGNEVTITIPPNALEKAVQRPGQSERFATAFVFMVACAGHIERIPRKGGLGPNAIPIGCFDSHGRELGPEDFVMGFTRVFVFQERRNALPNLDAVTFEGKPIDPTAGIVTGKCVKNGDTGECKSVKLGVLFDDAAAEVDPDNVDVDGHVGRETIYVDWFTTVGKFQGDRRVLFDGNRGRMPKPAIDFLPPNDPVKGKMWAILHDNRGGTSWLEFPIEIQ
jgi:hypothetical protein